MSRRVEVTARVYLPQPAQRVWQAVVDWPAQEQWMPGTRVRGGHGVGASVVARTGIGPAAFTDTMVITGWDPPRRCVVRHTGRLVRGDGIFEVVPLGGGSEFWWTERLELPLGAAGRAGWRVIGPLAQWGLTVALRRFAAQFR